MDGQGSEGKILITGGTGFVGTTLARRLSESGYTVVLYDIKGPSEDAAWLLKGAASRVIFHQGSIDNWSQVIEAFRSHQPSKVVHMAAIASPEVIAHDPLKAFRVNLEGSVNVFEACRLFGIRRLVYFSTVAVYPSKQYEPIDTAHPVILPHEGPSGSFYGATKLAGEALCFAYQQGFGLDFIILRPSAVYGFGMQVPLLLKPMVENSVRGLPTMIDHGREFPRAYTHVKDVAQIAHRALEVSGAVDRIFHAASGGPVATAGDVAEIVRDLIPGAQITINSGLTPEEVIDTRYRGRLDIGSARVQLAYEPEFADLRAGLADYIETYRQFLDATVSAPVTR